MLADTLRVPVGPFPSVPAFLDWIADMTKLPHNRGKVLPLDPYRYELPDNVPIVFTHNDLHRRNIMVSAQGDGDARILALVDSSSSKILQHDLYAVSRYLLWNLMDLSSSRLSKRPVTH